MMAQEPIPYELADPADELDHGLRPVDSATHTCCQGIGTHARDCTAGDDVEIPDEPIEEIAEEPDTDPGRLTSLTTKSPRRSAVDAQRRGPVNACL